MAVIKSDNITNLRTSLWRGFCFPAIRQGYSQRCSASVSLSYRRSAFSPTQGSLLMTKSVLLNGIELFNADCLHILASLPDNCVDLIITDPPYFKVKPDSWDRQWRGDEDYLEWLDLCLVEFARVLKPSGGIYMFCGHRLAADIEIMMRERFIILNHIIWAKPSGKWKGCNKESLRAYFPSTERVLFAEHYQGPFSPKSDGYAQKGAEQRQRIMKPLIDYFRDARNALGVSAEVINAATGKQMTSHWFSNSQWQLPGEEDYLKLQALFERIAFHKNQTSGLGYSHHLLTEKYGGLAKRYSELLQEYQALRRPFRVTALVPHTDVWTYAPVQHYPGKHPCEKPAEMMRDIIMASSREGDVLADFFMGSGSMIKEAMKLGRKAIGVEIEQERFTQTVGEIEALSRQEI